MDANRLIVLAGPFLLLGGNALKKPEQKPLRVTLIAIGAAAMFYAACREYAKGS